MLILLMLLGGLAAGLPAVLPTPGEGAVDAVLEPQAPEAALAPLAKASGWEWAGHLNGTSDSGDGEWIADVAHLSNGSAIIGGAASGSPAFPPLSTSLGLDVQGYVAFLNDTGVFSWVKVVDSDKTTWVDAVATNASGMLAYGGAHDGDLDLDGFELQDQFTSGQGLSTRDKGFVVMLDQNGDTQWALQVASGQHAAIHSIAFDGSGGLFVTGQSGASTFFIDHLANGTGDADLTLSRGGTGADGFVAHILANGTWDWVEHYGKNSSATGVSSRGLALNATHVVVSGSFTDDSFTAGDSAFTSNTTDDHDAFVLSYFRNGTLAWGQTWGGSGEDRAYDLTIAPNGTIIVAATIASSATLGSSTLTTGADGTDGVLVFLDGPTGVPHSHEVLGGSGVQLLRDVAVTGAGDIVTVGRAVLTVSVDGTAYSTAGSGGSFLAARWNATGGWTNVTLVGTSTAGSQGQAVAVDAWGNALAVGFLGGAWSFASGPTGTAGTSDGFHASFAVDRDRDGVLDTADACWNATRFWASNSGTDHDGDGCRDSDEDGDDDDDGVLDGSDDCSTGDLGWTANLSTDWDSDGCRDDGEDTDDDSDDVLDGADDCPRGYTLDIGQANGVLVPDLDGDGCMYLNFEDWDDDNDTVNDTADNCPSVVAHVAQFPLTNWTSNASNDRDADGCFDATEDGDDDGDGVVDGSDDCPAGVLNWTSNASSDHDGDGCLDSDAEDTDDDNDGVSDGADACAAGDRNWTANGSTDGDNDGCQDAGEDQDDDNDLVNDTADDCTPGVQGWNSTNLTDHDGDGCRDDDPEDSDDDNDGLLDGSDDCPVGDLGWTSNASTDLDGDGCRDDGAEDTDDDGDGVLDGADDCARGATGWSSNGGTDLDGDGCRDSSEDADDDGDGVNDTADRCATGVTGWISNATSDHDGDGCQDAHVEDQDDDDDGRPDGVDDCATGDLGWISNASSDHDTDGCRDAGEDLDDDADGVLDLADACSVGVLGWTSTNLTDHDADGCRDVDEDLDDDDDLIADTSDACTPGEIGWNSSNVTDHDGDGCRDDGEDLDDDDDSVLDLVDLCPRGAVNWTSNLTTDIDLDGCLDGVEDSDNDDDGLLNLVDDCPTGDAGWTSNATTDHDSDGCRDAGAEDLDDDNDGRPDAVDTCERGLLNWTSASLVDHDGDGCHDAIEDPDDDNDGLNDSAGDQCQAGALNWTSNTSTDHDGDGCRDDHAEDPDDDNDLVLDVADDCQWGVLGWNSSAVTDNDGDGCQDAHPEDPDDDNDLTNDTLDACPLTWGNSSTDRLACIDSDGDGWSDGDANHTALAGADACPSLNASSHHDRNGCPDLDGDGWSDADANHTTVDAADSCPLVPANSSEDRTGCPDRDGDGWSDPDGANPLGSGVDEEPDDATQHRDTTPPTQLPNLTATDEDEAGGVLLLDLGWAITNWTTVPEQDRPTWIQIHTGAPVGATCDDDTLVERHPFIGVLPFSSLRVANLTNDAPVELCIELHDWAGNIAVLTGINGTPTRNEPPVAQIVLSQTVEVGEEWNLSLCDVFSDVETPCAELTFTATPANVAIDVTNLLARWNPTASDTALTNVQINATDAKGATTSSNAFTISVNVTDTSGSGDGTPQDDEEEAPTVSLPLLGEVEVTTETIFGLIGSLATALVAVVLALVRVRKGRAAKRVMDGFIREIHAARTGAQLEAVKRHMTDELNVSIDSDQFNTLQNLLKERRTELVDMGALSAPATGGMPTSGAGMAQGHGGQGWQDPNAQAWQQQGQYADPNQPGGHGGWPPQ